MSINDIGPGKQRLETPRFKGNSRLRL